MTIRTDDADAVDGEKVTEPDQPEAAEGAEGVEGVEAAESADTASVDETQGDLSDGAAEVSEGSEASEAGRRNVGRFFAFVVLPVVVLVMAVGVGFLKWQANGVAPAQTAVAEAVSAATEATIAMLSYRADQVDRDLTAASGRMTGGFRDEYTTLINDVVIPGAKEQRISAVATVPAAAMVSASADRAEVLVYIDQTTTVGDQPPTATMSSARVSLEKVENRWLLCGFEPV